MPVVLADALGDHERVGVEQQRAPAVEADGALQDLDRLAAQRVAVDARVGEQLDALAARACVCVLSPREPGYRSRRGHRHPNCVGSRVRTPQIWDWPGTARSTACGAARRARERHGKQVRDVAVARARHTDRARSRRGRALWFLDGDFTFKATGETTGGELFVMETLLPAGLRPAAARPPQRARGLLRRSRAGSRSSAAPSASRREQGLRVPAERDRAHVPRDRGRRRRGCSGSPCPAASRTSSASSARPAETPGPAAAGPDRPAALAQAAARHGNEFVGPPLGA